MHSLIMFCLVFSHQMVCVKLLGILRVGVHSDECEFPEVSIGCAAHTGQQSFVLHINTTIY